MLVQQIGIHQPRDHAFAGELKPAELSQIRASAGAFEFDFARQLDIAVNRSFAAAHLHGNRVIDPVANRFAIRNERRERKRAGIKLRNIEVEIDRADFAFRAWRQSVPFAVRVGTR